MMDFVEGTINTERFCFDSPLNTQCQKLSEAALFLKLKRLMIAINEASAVSLISNSSCIATRLQRSASLNPSQLPGFI